MLLNQMAAPNSPQWFNTGLNWAYGITGPPQGHWRPDPATGRTELAAHAYTPPPPLACYIQSLQDCLVRFDRALPAYRARKGSLKVYVSVLSRWQIIDYIKKLGGRPDLEDAELLLSVAEEVAAATNAGGDLMAVIAAVVGAGVRRLAAWSNRVRRGWAPVSGCARPDPQGFTSRACPRRRRQCRAVFGCAARRRAVCRRRR